MAFTEFCCKAGGSNLNSGTRTGSSTEPGTSADFTYASGSWVASTGVFTVASGNPQTDGVAVGDFASVYADGSSVTGFVGRVTAVSSTTITVSLTAKSGTAPTNGTLNRTLKIGGAWQGPNGASFFPFGFADTAMKNASGSLPRINLKNDATYSVTAGGSHSVAGPIFFQGYSTTYGDRGKAKIEGPATGAAFVLLAISPSTSFHMCDIWFDRHGDSGTVDLVTVTQQYGVARRCVFSSARARGLYISSSNWSVTDCEFYNCNTSGSSGYEAFRAGAAGILDGVVVSGTSGSGSYGVHVDSQMELRRVISYSNAGVGVYLAGGGALKDSDTYANGSDGVLVGGRVVVIENCNLVANSGYGVNSTAPLTFVNHCGFGSGTKANVSGAVNLPVSGVNNGAVTYTADTTPWTDPGGGDFSMPQDSEAIDSGESVFMQDASGDGPTTGYADIGAVGTQHQTGGGSSSPYFGSGGRGFRPVRA